MKVNDIEVPYTPDELIGLARDYIQSQFDLGVAFESPQLVRDFWITKLGMREKEVFCVAYLNNQHQLIECEELFHGTINSASVHPREVVKNSLRHNAAAVIIAHNHPSGKPEPSGADRQITTKLRDALGLVDIRLLDHFIVGGGETTSFAERGWL